MGEIAFKEIRMHGVIVRFRKWGAVGIHIGPCATTLTVYVLYKNNIILFL